MKNKSKFLNQKRRTWNFIKKVFRRKAFYEFDKDSLWSIQFMEHLNLNFLMTKSVIIFHSLLIVLMLNPATATLSSPLLLSCTEEIVTLRLHPDWYVPMRKSARAVEKLLNLRERKWWFWQFYRWLEQRNYAMKVIGHF